jgi:hypothetical protein
MVEMTYPPKMKQFPLKHWPVMLAYDIAYAFSLGSGFTGCTIVSPDLKVEYGNTGELQVWAMFESIAYRDEKFLSMLKLADYFAQQERVVLADSKLSEKQRQQKLSSMRFAMWQTVSENGRIDSPPKGFTWEQAFELFSIAEQ